MSSGTESIARLVLDTSAYAHFRHGHPDVMDALAGSGVVLIPAIVLGELEAGFQLGSKTKENRLLLAEFCAEPFVATLPVTEEVARRYGQVLTQLRRDGTPIPTNDIWIAATTLDCAGHLLTFDDDFRRVASLDCTTLKP